MKKLNMFILLFLCAMGGVTAQTAGGANGMVFRFTKQVWLNPTIILAKQNFEQSTNVKLLILPRVNATDTTGTSKLEKAFDKLLSFLVYKENVQGSIKFYFNPKNPDKPFTFNTSEEIGCKFLGPIGDSVEHILNDPIVNNPNLNNFTALPFDTLINRASRFCKKVLQRTPGPCGANTASYGLTQINSTPGLLNFGKSKTQLLRSGGVDNQKFAEYAQHYNHVTDVADNSSYTIPWKAFKTNSSDNIKLKLSKKEPGFDVSRIKFKNAQGDVTYNTGTYSATDSSIVLSMSGQSPGTMAEIVAYYTPTATPTQTYAIGAVNAQFYDEKPYNVVLVSLNTAPLQQSEQDKIRDSLNKIYGNIFIKWSVSNVRYDLPSSINKNIHYESSGLLSNYMSDMQPILTSFKNSTQYNGSSDNTFYIILGATCDNNDLKGYMPRARNTGFIFSLPSNSSAFIRNLAHELGHGAFNLKHIFSSDELGAGNLGQTDNLMDYSSGQALYKHQWDLVHDPSFVSWFAGDDEEGALLVNQNYFNPAGLVFHSAIDALTSLYSVDIINGTKLNGILYGFTKDNIKYEAKIENNKFYGYYNGNNIYPDDTDLPVNAKLKVKSANFVGNCQVQYYLIDYTVTVETNSSTYQNGVSILSSFNATAGKKIDNPITIPDCQIDYDAPLTNGVGKQAYDTYSVNINVSDTAALRELKRIGNLINKVGPDLYNSYKGAVEWNNNPQSDLFSFFHYINNTPPLWTKASLNATLLGIKKYYDAVQQFKLLTNSDNFSTTQLKTIINQNFVCCNSFKFLFKAPFYQLSATQRNNILKVFLNDTWVKGRLNIGEEFENEDIILNALTTCTVKGQHKPILDFLKKNGLIYKITKNVDGSNYEAVTTTLTQWVIEEYPVPNPLNVQANINKKGFLHFNDNYFGKNNTENVTEGDSIKLRVEAWGGGTGIEYDIKCGPYDYIVVTFQNNFTLGSGATAAGFVANTPYKLPAIFVYLLFNSDTKAKWLTTGKIAVNVALLAIGVGEITAAVESGVWTTSSALAVADMGIGFSDIVINIAFRNEIQSKYPQFFKVWEKISLCYGIGRISQVALSAAYKRCFIESQIIHNRNAFSQSTRNTASEIELRLQNQANFAEFIDQPALASELTFFTNVDNNYPGITARIGQMDDETRLAFYNDFQNNPNNALQNFESNPSQLDNWVQTRQVSNTLDNLANAFINGWTKESILALPKGSRPLPSVYLKSEYIANHLAKFENGASYLVPKSALDNYGRALIGRPDGQFVMSKLDMDNLLAKANGDLTVIETELGIPGGLWKDKDLVRIDIPNPKQLNSRMPSGNEGGANELWLPGGKLPKGYSEAVIDQIPQSSYVEILTNIK